VACVILCVSHSNFIFVFHFITYWLLHVYVFVCLFVCFSRDRIMLHIRSNIDNFKYEITNHFLWEDITGLVKLFNIKLIHYYII
jgi:hypothetical protein